MLLILASPKLFNSCGRRASVLQGADKQQEQRQTEGQPKRAGTRKAKALYRHGEDWWDLVRKAQDEAIHIDMARACPFCASCGQPLTRLLPQVCICARLAFRFKSRLWCLALVSSAPCFVTRSFHFCRFVHTNIGTFGGRRTSALCFVSPYPYCSFTSHPVSCICHFIWHLFIVLDLAGFSRAAHARAIIISTTNTLPFSLRNLNEERTNTCLPFLS